MLGPWIALICIILGGVSLAVGLGSNAGGLVVLGVLLFVFAGIYGAKGSFVRHDVEEHGHH